MSEEDDKTLKAEIAGLGSLGLQELRATWQKRIGRLPRIRSADLARLWIAYELQVRAYGGLKPETRRRLKHLYKAFKADPKYTSAAHLGLRPGLVLTRTWKGVTHQVTVLEQGFAFDGETYASLSEIAHRITGSRRSGPLFFGLKG